MIFDTEKACTLGMDIGYFYKFVVYGKREISLTRQTWRSGWPVQIAKTGDHTARKLVYQNNSTIQRVYRSANYLSVYNIHVTSQ